MPILTKPGYTSLSPAQGECQGNAAKGNRLTKNPSKKNRDEEGALTQKPNCLDCNAVCFFDISGSTINPSTGAIAARGWDFILIAQLFSVRQERARRRKAPPSLQRLTACEGVSLCHEISLSPDNWLGNSRPLPKKTELAIFAGETVDISEPRPDRCRATACRA